MKKLLFVFFITALVNYTASAQEARSISVVGESSVEVDPDEIILSFTVKEEISFDEEEETKNFDQIEEGIKKFLKEKNVKESALTNGKPKTIMGMPMTKGDQRNYNLKLTNPKLIPEMIKNLPVLGASNVSVSSLKSNKEEEIKTKIQKEALLKAKAKAQNLLSVFDEKVGNVIEITEQSASSTADPFSNSLGKMYDMIFSKLLPMMDSGDDYKVKIEYSVTVKFAIK